jgi:cytochrome P450
MGPEDRSAVPSFDHFDRDFMIDPYPGYAHLRDECPVHHSDLYGGFYVLSKFRDITHAAQRTDLFSSEGDALAIPPNAARPLPISTDPPLHRRYRGVMAAYFSPRRVERMEPEVRRLANELIDGFIGRGACDIADELTSALPTIMLARMLGVPFADTHRFHHWVDTIIYSIAHEPEVSATAARELNDYVIDLVARHAAAPADDTFLTVMRDGPADGEPFTVDEQVRMVTQLIFGALHTTAYLINGALLLLDDDRAARQRLIDDPRLFEPAVEEFLRMLAPVQGIARKVTEATECFGQRFAEGDRVLLLFASGCRDADEFDAPEELRLDREPNRHMAFGVGIHRCVGAPLGRLQSRVVLEELLRRIPDYSIPDRDAIVWGASSTRGIIRLPIVWPVR